LEAAHSEGRVPLSWLENKALREEKKRRERERERCELNKGKFGEKQD